jgi:ribonuclease VapC
MIVDSSALIAIVVREPGYERLVDKLRTAGVAAAGAPTLAETGLVLHARLGAKADGLLERMLDEFGVQEIPFGEIHWREAVEAFRKYGKERHVASLNFGDCMTYATAKLAGAELLYVGDDFSHTDITAA